jgi:hypothetical protein
MQNPASQSGVEARGASAEQATKALLTCGVLAGPLYLIVSLGQALTRPGFDLTRHAWSLLENGDLGWMQISNLVLSGLLVVACAAGMRRALHTGPGRRWGPLLVGVYGLGLIGAGCFTADPALGFPPGTPDGPPTNLTLHGILHFVFAGVGFLSLIAACFVFARRFSALGQPGWMAYSIVTGVIFFAAFAGIASGSVIAWVNIAFAIAVVIASTWLSALSAKLIREIS